MPKKTQGVDMIPGWLIALLTFPGVVMHENAVIAAEAGSGK